MDQQAGKDQIERVTGLGRRTREGIGKWNQMTALRFQTGGRHQTDRETSSHTQTHLNTSTTFSHFDIFAALAIQHPRREAGDV